MSTYGGFPAGAGNAPLLPNQTGWRVVLTRWRESRRHDRNGLGAVARMGAGPDAGIGAGLETGTYTDPLHYPTGQVSTPVSAAARAPTDPCLGVSPWGGAYGHR
jgi:hypothetical protein